MKDKKLRLEDAIQRTKAAVEEGMRSGGGIHPCHAGSGPGKKWAGCPISRGEELIGATIVASALSAR